MTEAQHHTTSPPLPDPFDSAPVSESPLHPTSMSRPGAGADNEPVPVPSYVDDGDAHFVPETSIDARDIQSLNHQILAARARLWRLTHAANKAAHDASECEGNYQRAYRGALIARDEKSAEARKACAEQQCEGLDERRRVSTGTAHHLRRLAMTAKDDLEALYNLSHNLRAELTYTAR